MMRPICQSYFIQYGPGSLFPLCLTCSCIYKRQGYIFPCSKPGKQIELLEYETDLYIPHISQLIILHTAYVLTIEHILPCTGSIQAADVYSSV